ncbi:MAG: 16S rRNA (uracil(1498)-N(3))-methyltransferase [Chitinispirillales bacterium]|jgi:16S rRNA (uracil1498-N3)-methyltransferase|nr:16S rRNA (uracil(1498)-N(3))-methyltransferase [Chitinispirillales bacterium]
MNKKDTHFLFFSRSINENVILLDSDELAHISNVLRFCEGDEIQITDGKGNIFECRIVKIKRDSALCEIISSKFCKPFSLGITLAVGLPDKDKFETICEMLAPLGVKKIIPLVTRNCQKNYLDGRWEKTLERCERKVISSIKQSLNPYVTNIENPVNLGDFVSNCELNLLADFDGKRIGEIVREDKTPESVCIFVGPPAGFSSDEINLLSQNSTKIRIGKYRLRSELAAVAAAAAVGQYLYS